MIKIGNLNINNFKIGEAQVDSIYLGSTNVWQHEQPTPGWTGLTFTAQQANSTVKYNTGITNTTAEYSLDGVTWTAAEGVTITLANVGDKVYYRGTITGNISSTSTRFTMTGKIGASGSIMSMYNNNPDDTVITYEGAFRGMFYSCTSLTAAPELPATTLANYCYRGMFAGCTSLTAAPELPATTLANYCYSNMFSDCTSLTAAPELPATTLANYCYANMFYRCSSLNYVKTYMVNWSTSDMANWLYNVAETGTVECPAGSTIPSDSVSGIPTGWTKVEF